MSSAALSPEQITRRAKSNLAFALACLPPERKRDMIRFYAFCRVVDDIADDPTTTEDAKERELAHWTHCVLEGTPPGHPVLDEAVALPAKYGFPRAWLAEIIEGVASDITRTRYATFEELLGYCYKVASVVGLVSIEIFGRQRQETRDYAIQLGYALQLTNIMRDVGQDARDTGRIYLPQSELQKFGVTEADILAGRSSDQFLQLMEFQYQRARGYYDAAQRALPDADRPCLTASEIMAEIYSTILEKLRTSHYPVFEQRVRISRPHKLWILAKHLLRAKLGL